MKLRNLTKLWTAAVFLAVNSLTAGRLHSQIFGQWDFNTSNLVATAGSDLTYTDGGQSAVGPRFGTTASFGIPAIDGTNAVVMQFPGATNGMGFNLPTPAPNGRGSFVDNYTLILDVLFPSSSNLKPRPILEADGNYINSSLGTELAIGANNGAGLAGGTFDGAIISNTWYRVGFVVQTNRLRAYVNGALVGNQPAQADRLVLSPNSTALFLAESLTNTAAGGYLNSVQFRDTALTGDQMQALGGPAAAGIPQAIPAIPSYVVSWKPLGAASSTVTDLGVVINPGEATVNTNSITLKLNNTTQNGLVISTDPDTGLITVLKTAAGALNAGTTYTLQLSYTDSQAGAKIFSKQFKAALVFEDFESLTLGTNIDEAILVELTGGQPTYLTNVWTRTPPAGWLLDNSRMPGFGVITNDGVSEWAGWSFASKSFWSVETDDQDRAKFTYGQGTVAVADPDEWDDAAHPKTDTNGYSLYFNSFLSTRPISIAGYAANSIYMNFDSSWRPEGGDDWGGTNNQTAVITVSYNGGTAVQRMRWESIAGANFHPDAANERVSILLNNPLGATNMVVTFGLINGANDWWWAFDNVEINIGDIASTVVQLAPAAGATNNIAPRPFLGATIIPGTTTVNPATVQLLFDGQSVPITLATNAQNQFVVSGRAPAVVPDASVHTNRLIYSDNLNGLQTNTWSFTVDYDALTLGTPIWFENFDGVAEAALPTGWTVTNRTSALTTNLNLNDPSSASYENFVVVSTNRLGSVFNSRRFNVRPTTLNGLSVDTLMSGNLMYGESDNRGGNQVQVLFSPVINLTGVTGVKLAFNSIYEQNQDSMGAVEYSIDGGVTWLPAIYMVAQADVTAGDPVATLGTARSDQAWGTNYGAFIGAIPDASFAPYISARVDDDTTESKRIEILSLPLADNQANVRLRFTHTGTGSWYFGIDEVGFYGNGATNVPVQIANQPQPKSLAVGQASSLAVGINPSSTRPLSFQWLRNNTNLLGATSQILALASAQLTDAGSYRVIVSNVMGVVTSDVAVVTVENPFPSIFTLPLPQYVSLGAPASFTVGATSVVGTVTYQWYKQGGAALAGKTNATLSIASAQSADQGTYYVTVSNPAGSTNSALVQLAVFSGSAGDGLVAYLPFDGNYLDRSGRHNDGAPVGSPTFVPGRVGQSLRITTTNDGSIKNYVTLGYPPDLQFGTNNFAVAFWINYTNQTSDPSFISNKDWDSSNNPGWILAAQGGGNFRINATGTPGSSANRMNTTSTPTIRDGKWHFVLSSFWRGQSAATYVDGALVNTSPLTFTGTVDTVTNGFKVNIGQDGTGDYTGVFLDAYIDEVMLWNRAVTPQEATAFYNAGTNSLSPILTMGNLTRLGNSVTLNWNGGIPPFNVESKTNLNLVDWTQNGSTTNRSMTLSVGADAAFFRVRGAAQ